MFRHSTRRLPLNDSVNGFSGAGEVHGHGMHLVD